MNVLWTLDEMIAAMGARPVGVMPESVTGISIDSRSLQPGEAFFAIRGEHFDGHDFAIHAMKAGAVIAVVSEEKLVALGSLRLPLLVVRDVLKALEKLGIAARKRNRGKIIAITGSAGKTSTKEMLRAVLGRSGRVHASAASFNNHWGVPLTLARMPADASYGIFEIGMNHAGEIRPLSKLVRPHIAIITNISAAHIGSFANLEAIAYAKAEIFEGVEENGTALIERDGKYFSLLGELARKANIRDIRSFGRKRGADFRLAEVECSPEGSIAQARIDGQDIDFKLQIPGEHFVVNALAVLGAASIAGADLADSVAALAAVQPEAGRGRQHITEFGSGTITLIDESYNANPASMEASLKVLGNFQPAHQGRRVAVLGDMRELGEYSEKLHRALKKPIENNDIDLVFLAGPEMAALAEELEEPRLAGYFDDTESLAAALKESLSPDDVVMIKASNALQFSSLVASLTIKNNTNQKAAQ
jgi:UDP-N-acetylmuramoyl-tripeptide--D-alanyl-D-alanine ligase